MATNRNDVPVVDASTVPWALKSLMISSTLGPYNWCPVSTGTGGGGVYSAAGDNLTSAALMLNPGAWWVLRGRPMWDGASYSQQLCFQVDGTGGVRAKVSARAGFTGGSPAPGRVPSAADERVWLGGGTDGSPTYATVWPVSGAWLQARCDESSDALWAISYPVGGAPGSGSSLLFVDGTPITYVGGSLSDKAPWAYFARGGASCALATTLASEVTGPLGVLAYGVTASNTALDAWVRLPASVLCSIDSVGALQVTLPGAVPQDPSLPSFPTYPQAGVRLARRAALSGTSTGANESGNLLTCGDKGELSSIRYSGRLFTTPTLLQGVDQQTGLAALPCVGFGNLVLPWECGLSLRDGA